MRRHLPWAIRVACALGIGVAFPYVELTWKCRQGLQASEACVWGRAYFPLTRAVEPLIIAPILFGVLTAIARLRARQS